MNIQLYFLRVRNVWKQIYRFFERRWKRNALWSTVIIIFFVTGLGLGKAWASEPPSARLSVREPERVLSGTQRLQRDRSDWVSATSTTTTTLPVIRKSRSTETKSAVKLPPPKQVNYVAPQEDWVAQCHMWAAEAGIELPPAAITLIGRESSCNPSVMNHGGSGAGGIPQALPASKMGCSMDAAGAPCQLRWMHGYVMGRYGSWENALAHSLSKNWY